MLDHAKEIIEELDTFPSDAFLEDIFENAVLARGHLVNDPKHRPRSLKNQDTDLPRVSALHIRKIPAPSRKVRTGPDDYAQPISAKLLPRNRQRQKDGIEDTQTQIATTRIDALMSSVKTDMDI